MSLGMKHAAAACAIAMLAAAPVLAQSTQSAQQQQNQPAQQAGPQPTAAPQDRATTVEFTTVTRLPGITLQPGKYVFRLGQPVIKQNVVEIYSSDGTRKIATLLTVDYVVAPTRDAIVVFDKTNPQVVRVWYFPGDTVGREFVYTQDEAKTLFATASTPVLWATWDPNDRTIVGRVEVQTVGQAAGEAARAIADVVRDIADMTEDVWDDITDNIKLVDPTDSRKAAERQLDAAEKVYNDLDDRLTDLEEAPLKPMRAQLEALEDSFEKNEPVWMTHYTAVMASLDILSPEKPVGTTGGRIVLDASTHAALATIRGHLRAFYAQAMK